MKKPIMFCMYGKLMITWDSWHLAIFGTFLLLFTAEYLPHKDLDWKVIDPKVNTTLYGTLKEGVNIYLNFG